MFGYTQSLLLFAIKFLLFSYFYISEAPTFLLHLYIKSLESLTLQMNHACRSFSQYSDFADKTQYYLIDLMPTGQLRSGFSWRQNFSDYK